MKHIIDCDKKPNLPYKGWSIETHIKGGKLEWKSEAIELYLSERQQSGYIPGRDLRKELEGKPVLNACVLEYLLEHQDLIPETWNGKYVYFWGTIFRGADGDLCIEYLYWGGGGWDWSYDWLHVDWSDFDPAASLASMPSSSRRLDSSLALEPLDSSHFGIGRVSEHVSARNRPR